MYINILCDLDLSSEFPKHSELCYGHIRSNEKCDRTNRSHRTKF